MFGDAGIVIMDSIVGLQGGRLVSQELREGSAFQDTKIKVTIKKWSHGLIDN